MKTLSTPQRPLGGSRPAAAQPWTIAPDNAARFGALLKALSRTYENPTAENLNGIDAAVESIAAENAGDGRLAEAIAAHWQAAFIDPGAARRACVWRPGDAENRAFTEALKGVDPAFHAFVVLGYELENGEMTRELALRCEAAAFAARAYPAARLICSGGATGANNPDGHTEAGEMKRYLSGHCGVEAGRILTDEAALSTVENAVNTFEIMRSAGIRTMTVITSLYHQRWGQALYNAEAALYALAYGTRVGLAGELSCEVEPLRVFDRDDKWAVSQLASLLALPEDVRRDVNEALGMREVFRRFLAERGLSL